MRIGELADQTGASVRSLRYYEEQELLLSERTQGGQRTFPPDAVDRVQLIQVLLAAGVPSRRIAEIMPCVHTGSITRPMFDGLLAERDRIDEQILALTATRDRLDGVIEEARERLVPATHGPEHQAA